MSCSFPRNPEPHGRSGGRLLRALLSVLAGLLAGALPAAQTLKIATVVPEGSVWDKALRRMGAEWKDATGGRCGLTLYPSGVAGDESEIFKKIKIGQIQGAFVSASGLGSFDPAFNLFGIPMYLRSDQELAAVVAEAGPFFEQRLAERGYVLVHWGFAGWLRIFSTRPVRSFEDFKGLKFFVWGQGNQLAEWFEARGFRSVILPSTEVATGLQTGLVESLPATPLTALSFQWFRSAPYMFDHRFAPLVGGTVVSAKAWEKLSVADRAQLFAAGKRAAATLFQDVPGQEDEALAEMKKRGLSLTRSSAEDLGKWEELSSYLEGRFRADSVPAEAFAVVGPVLARLRGQGEGGKH
jgi:TRAP-type C4-dicarboxylate transport system substrate-binding protein